jgi:hypothetical protein
VQCDVQFAMQHERPMGIDLAKSDVKKLEPEDFQGCRPAVKIEHYM